MSIGRSALRVSSVMLLLISSLLTLVVLPGLMLLWLLRGSRSILPWTLRLVAVGSAVLAVFYVGTWQMLSVYGRYVLLGLFAVSAGVGAWRLRSRPLWTSPQGWGWIGPVGALALLLATIPLHRAVLRADRLSEPPVALTFPMRGGPFYVLSAGSTPLMNPHMKVGDPRRTKWRGQLWGVDVVKLYPSGNRARGLYPSALDRYAIFGEPIYAPCAGRVVAARDSLPDLPPPATDVVHKAGNFVQIRCGAEAYVLLAHMKRGSVRVQPGDSVSTDTWLGRVGNSGNTSEPHLHLHAQHAIGDSTLLDAAPRPITLDGSVPRRNELVHGSGS